MYFIPGYFSFKILNVSPFIIISSSSTNLSLNEWQAFDDVLYEQEQRNKIKINKIEVITKAREILDEEYMGFFIKILDEIYLKI